MGTIINAVLMIIAIEAVVEIIVQGDVFIGFRNWLARINPGFLGKLIGCGYCMSVWASTVFVLVYVLLPQYRHIEMIVVYILVFHRLSNMIHELFHKWINRHPLVIEFRNVPIFMEPTNEPVQQGEFQRHEGTKDIVEEPKG